MPDARTWSYDFSTGRFRDDAGNDITREGFESAVQLGDPGRSGIGVSTLQRAVITGSAVRSFERQGAQAVVLGAAQRRVAPARILYSQAAAIARTTRQASPESGRVLFAQILARGIVDADGIH